MDFWTKWASAVWIFIRFITLWAVYVHSVTSSDKEGPFHVASPQKIFWHAEKFNLVFFTKKNFSACFKKEFWDATWNGPNSQERNLTRARTIYERFHSVRKKSSFEIAAFFRLIYFPTPCRLDSRESHPSLSTENSFYPFMSGRQFYRP